MRTSKSFPQQFSAFAIGFLCLLMMGANYTALSQPCPSTDYFLFSQADVNAFPSGCTTIDGDLFIAGSDITDLSSLAGITHIGGSLFVVFNPVLENVDNLSALASIMGELIIFDNPLLANVNGFSGLNSVGSLSVSENDILQNVDGLSSITTVNGFIGFSNNDALLNLDGLSHITSVSGGINITMNPVLNNVNGLSNIHPAVAELFIVDNPALINIGGLSGITSVTGNLLIGNNCMLENVDGLSSLTSVLGFMSLNNNMALQNVDGLSALTQVGAELVVINTSVMSNVDGLAGVISVGGFLQIAANSGLTDCCGIQDLISTPGAVVGSIFINDNDTGCDSEPEVNYYCQDTDMDGVNIADGDCDDNAPANFPGNTEICDSQDNDCDGEVDEGFETYNGNIAFTSQAQLNAWPYCYSTINGHVTISGANISDLSPLMNVQTITGNLTIQYTGLVSMAGLNGLSTVVGILTIYFNSKLVNLDGLDALAAVGGSFKMYYNFKLSNCCAVHILINGGVGGAVTILFNKLGCNSVAEINNNCAPAQLLIGGNGGQVIGAANTLTTDIKEVSIFPNPTKGAFTVRIPAHFENGELTVLDIHGRQVMGMGIAEGQTAYHFDSGQLSTGVYLVCLKSEGQAAQVERLVVE